MIRVIVLVLGLFVLWLLFLSKLSKQQKIIFSLLAVALGVVGVGYESYGKTPRNGLIEVAQVADCGSTAEHSYRSNYNVTFCLQNKATNATVKRVQLRFIAEDCKSGECQVLDSINKGYSINIAPGEVIRRTESLAFNKLARGANGFIWRVEPLSVKATR